MREEAGIQRTPGKKEKKRVTSRKRGIHKNRETKKERDEGEKKKKKRNEIQRSKQRSN